jgi:hypothetical protein
MLAQAVQFRSLLLFVTLALLLTTFLVPTAGAGVSSRPQLVRVYAPDPAAAYELLRNDVDLVSARDGEYLFALLAPQQQRALLNAGWHMQTVAGWQAADLQNAQEYQTFAAVENRLNELAAAHPDLLELVDYGDSWEGSRDLLALRLRAPGIEGPRPVFFLFAAVHAREMVTGDIALRWIDYLLNNYGTNADVTWMLQEHEFLVVPIANPDGRIIAEQGHLQRKNTNYSNGASCAVPPAEIIVNHSGVDLNRNSSFQWGRIDTPAQNPCSQTFPGSGPASEPEVQAFEALAAATFPALPGPSPAEGNPAPDDTSGIFISLHSFGDMVLWPWGHTEDTAPNGPALERLGRQLAERADFIPLRSYDLYPTSGTNDVWVYATLGRAAYTFEIGPIAGMCGGFMPPISCLDANAAEGGALWERTRSALLYAARVSRAPYLLPAGPRVTEVQADHNDNQLIVRANIDGAGTVVSGAQFSIGRSIAAGGAGIAMQASDGAFDSPQEQVELVLPLAELPDLDQAVLLIEGRNQQHAGPPQAFYARTIGPLNWLPLVQRP